MSSDHVTTIADHRVIQNKLILEGQEVDALEGDTFERLSPAHDVVVSRYAKGGAEDVNRAVGAARRGRMAANCLKGFI